MKYQVQIMVKGKFFTRKLEAVDMDELADTVEWKYPGSRIAKVRAIG